MNKRFITYGKGGEVKRYATFEEADYEALKCKSMVDIDLDSHVKNLRDYRAYPKQEINKEVIPIVVTLCFLFLVLTAFIK